MNGDEPFEKKEFFCKLMLASFCGVYIFSSIQAQPIERRPISPISLGDFSPVPKEALPLTHHFDPTPRDRDLHLRLTRTYPKLPKPPTARANTGNGNTDGMNEGNNPLYDYAVSRGESDFYEGGSFDRNGRGRDDD